MFSAATCPVPPPHCASVATCVAKPRFVLAATKVASWPDDDQMAAVVTITKRVGAETSADRPYRGATSAKFTASRPRVFRTRSAAGEPRGERLSDESRLKVTTTFPPVRRRRTRVTGLY
jgi:hypothetical protein